VRPRRAIRHAGVTLLELLVAVGVLGVIAGLLYGTFSRTMLSREYVQTRAATYAAARLAIDWLERDLMGSFAIGAYPSGLKRFISPGYAGLDTLGRDTPLLDFIASSARGTTPLERPGFIAEGFIDRGDQARIVYRVERNGGDEDAAALLVRYELRPPLMTDFAPATRAVIASGIESVTLRFYDGHNWHDDWSSVESDSSQRRGPRVVELRLSLVDDAGPATFVSAVHLPLGGIGG